MNVCTGVLNGGIIGIIALFPGYFHFFNVVCIEEICREPGDEGIGRA